MASFEEHIDQAKRNLSFLCEVNSKMQFYWDWQVTTCFYVAVHLNNAHLAKTANLHYRAHEAVKNELNPNSMSGNPACRVNEDIYLVYVKLEGYARRARYLCHQDKDNHSVDAHTTYSKHLAKSVKQLDKLLNFFAGLYSVNFDPPPVISCPDLTKQNLLSVFKLNT